MQATQKSKRIFFVCHSFLFLVGAHEWVPGLHSLGWAIAITPYGVELLEGNDDRRVPPQWVPCVVLKSISKYV